MYIIIKTRLTSSDARNHRHMAGHVEAVDWRHVHKEAHDQQEVLHRSLDEVEVHTSQGHHVEVDHSLDRHVHGESVEGSRCHHHVGFRSSLLEVASVGDNRLEEDCNRVEEVRDGHSRHVHLGSHRRHDDLASESGHGSHHLHVGALDPGEELQTGSATVLVFAIFTFADITHVGDAANDCSFKVLTVELVDSGLEVSGSLVLYEAA